MNVEVLTKYGLDAAVPRLLAERKITELNDVQRAALDAGLLSGSNVVVSAPTSSGKTLIGELVAAQHAGQGLTVFLCSHRALAAQVFSVFETRYIVDGAPLLKVGILTRDQDTVRGEWSRFDVIVATYEKLYSDLVGGCRSLHRLRAVVADEVQIVGEPERGPGLELLLARLRQKSNSLQLVGLSATVPNGALLAEWLDAAHVSRSTRTPPLEHEIWVPKSRWVYRPGAEEEERLPHAVNVESVSAVVDDLLRRGLGPVAVMATTRRSAGTYAAEIAAVRPSREDFPRDVLDEFRGMGRDENTTERLCGCLLKGVGVHYADLSQEQRRVVEDAFFDGHLDVLVATPTLVAGVNLPIRTVVYPRMTRWNGSEDAPISRSEYVNGSGRAGRQGLHEAGTSIILAESLSAARHLVPYVQEGCEPVTSRLGDRNAEFRVLHLLASTPGASAKSLADLAGGTLWARENGWVGTDERIAALEAHIGETFGDKRWAPLWESTGQKELKLTPVGRAVAASGLEPAIALDALDALRTYDKRRGLKAGRDAALRRYLATLCTRPGMDGFLPFENRRTSGLANDLSEVLDGDELGKRAWTVSNVVALGHALDAIGDASIGESIGTRMRGEVAERSGVTDRLERLTTTACAMADADDAAAMETTIAELADVAERLRFQVPARAVPIERLFSEHRVRHVGPAKRAKLVELVGAEVGRLLTVPPGQLVAAVGKRQVEPVRRAALAYLEGLTREQSARQLSEAEADAELADIVRDLLRFKGVAFNPAVAKALRALGWKVSEVEEGGPEKKVDLEGTADDGQPVLIECKTTEDLGAEVSRKEAFDIERKVPDAFAGNIVTVGRPVFSAEAIERSIHPDGSRRVHLVTAGAIVELLLACRLKGLPLAKAGPLLRTYAHADVGRIRVALGPLAAPRLNTATPPRPGPRPAD